LPRLSLLISCCTQKQQVRVSTWVSSGWKSPDLLGHFWVEINTTGFLEICDGTGLVTNLDTNKKALVSEGFDDKQVLDFVGCGGKI
ncbi:hypothetical protein, partial [Hydrogenophaga sp.]|uniref:hypothetical protein n=1 Tax=Hydrogenophaga sp. TaxID=1904254 RepID=UPI003D0CCA1A